MQKLVLLFGFIFFEELTQVWGTQQCLFTCWMNVYTLNLQMTESIRWSLSQTSTAWGFCQGPWADRQAWNKVSEGLTSAVTQDFPLNFLWAVGILLMGCSHLQRLTTFSHWTTDNFPFWQNAMGLKSPRQQTKATPHQHDFRMGLFPEAFHLITQSPALSPGLLLILRVFFPTFPSFYKRS